MTQPVYLMCVAAPFYAVDERTAAVESAFARHLVALRDSLAPHYRELVVTAPQLDAAGYEPMRARCLELSAERDSIRFVGLRRASAGRLEALRSVPSIARRLWSEVGRAGVVHSGPSGLYMPMENVALVVAWLRGRRRVYVVDIDWRESARMNLATGTWSRGVFWRTKLMHHSWLALQTVVARFTCHMLLLKGRKLVAELGGNAPHVHWFLDAVHSDEMVLDDRSAALRRARVAASREPLRCVYFGRLTAYKGVTAMIDAVARARELGARIRFDIFGEGEQEAELHQRVERRGIADIATFHGSKPYGVEFLESLDEFDLMFAAPLSEDTPRSAVDAQSRGIPILAFDTYYYRELASAGASVHLSPWRDTEAFAARLVEFAADRGPLAEGAEAAARFARENTQEIWLARRAAWTLG